jgi:uncharacterized membrane protein YGL010W
MKTMIDQLAQYGAYHRDPRNIATHFVGVPMIVLGVVMLLSYPLFMLGGMSVSLALLVSVATSIFYFRMDTRYGIAMAVELAAFLAIGQWVAAMGMEPMLGVGFGIFALGWLIQFIGHYYEGRKPAFVDDLVGLVIAPLFVMAEVGFALKLRLEVQAAIDARVGPVRLRRTLAA